MKPRAQRAELPPSIMAEYGARKARYEGGFKEGYDKGWSAGVKESGKLAYRSIYGALLIVLHDEFGFEKQRLYKLLSQTDQRILESLNHVELVDEAWEKTGLRLNFEAPFDRIEAVDEE